MIIVNSRQYDACYLSGENATYINRRSYTMWNYKNKGLDPVQVIYTNHKLLAFIYANSTILSIQLRKIQSVYVLTICSGGLEYYTSSAMRLHARYRLHNTLYYEGHTYSIKIES